MELAIIHEWFVNYLGPEKCIESFVNIFNDADIFALIDFLNSEEREKILQGKSVECSFIQGLPFAKKRYWSYLPLAPLAIEQLDISKYDVILSSSHSVAKGVLSNSSQLHICYCHTPLRSAWDLYHQSLKETGNQKGISGFLYKLYMHRMRTWDYTTRNRVNHFIANSNHVAKRINKVYGMPADVIYPPVDIDKFECESKKENYYLTVSRLMPYKKIDLIVQAFTKLPDRKLIVIGNGPEEKRIKEIATPNIEILDYQPFSKLLQLMQKARAFIFAAQEDFGITNVEAESCGTPVIAYKIGGASESVEHGKTGILYNEQTPESLIEAIHDFEKIEDRFDPHFISNHASRFSRKTFEINIKNYVENKYHQFIDE